MFGAPKEQAPQELQFLLVPNFSMMAFTSSIEPLRAANRLSERRLYSWRTLSLDGRPVAASNGVLVEPDDSLDTAPPAVAVIVCAGVFAEGYRNREVFTWLQRAARQGIAVGGVCTGPLVLARAGLLRGYRCTIHWENVEGFVEEFPDHDITATLFEVDRDRCTCSGGTAPLDMMLHLIAQDQGTDLALSVAEQMLHAIMRHPHAPQRMSLRYRTGISHPKLLAVIAQMEAHLESPLPMEQHAAAVGLSTRQLERLFRSYLGKPPSRYCMELRLRRARLLLMQTAMPILQVAVACGFTSASHFARCYRELFGRSPRAERMLADTRVADSFGGRARIPA
jgi:transcriptional regulator GlxA family with amidase domain